MAAPSLRGLWSNGRSAAEFWSEWSHESDPWREAWYDGDSTLERRTLACFVGFVALHYAMIALKPTGRGRTGWLGSTLASRTTLVANHLHCTAVSVLAVYLLARHPRGTLEDYRSWQVLGLPLSLAYFLGDIYWYCIPQRDYLIAFHHATMLACHYPVGSDAGAALCGAGDALFAVRLSLLGYLCELSNPLMNWRWWLMQTLQAHRWDFAVVNVLLMLSFVLRAVLLGWLLCGVLLPRAADFVEAKQVFIYGTCVLGHGVILALSLFWLRVLLKNGLRGLLVFRVDPAKVAGFSTFGSDMGRAAPKSKQKRR